MYSRSHTAPNTPSMGRSSPSVSRRQLSGETLLVPENYHGEMLRRPQKTSPPPQEEAVPSPREPAAGAEDDAHPIPQEKVHTDPAGMSGGLLSELSHMLFGRHGEEDALLIAGIGLLLMNSRMERGDTPLFSGGHLQAQEEDIGLLLILLLLFS